MPDESTDPALNASAEESVEQHDSDSSLRRADSGRAGRDSTAIGGNAQMNVRAGRDAIAGNQTNQKSFSFGGVAAFIGIGVGVLLAGGFLVQQVSSTGTVTAESTCAEYLALEPGVRDAAVKRISVDLGVRGGGPFRVYDVDYACGNKPSRQLGEVIALFR